jgi:hypothetical protein
VGFRQREARRRTVDPSGSGWFPEGLQGLNPGARGIVPQVDAAHYVKVPTAAALLLMPVLGGLMVVLLPFIGLYLAATAMPGWAPGEAHFTGKATRDRAADEEKAAQEKLEQLAREVEEKRRS